VKEESRPSPLLRAVTLREGCRRIVRAAAAAAATTTGTATSAAATTAGTRAAATAPGTAPAAGLTTTAARAAAGLAATLAAPATLTAASASRAAGDRARQHGVRGCAKTMIRGSAESVKDSYNDKRNSDDQKRIFGCILSGFLPPEPFEGRHHDNTFVEGTLDIRL
jgi:hypothetical protein